VIKADASEPRNAGLGDCDFVLQFHRTHSELDTGRINPSFQVSASAGADVYRSERVNVKSQVDGQNLTNVLDVIDFGGLFSGNAIGPSRSYAVRLTAAF
jgi:hypothetical protein